jgi:hypothetical protein
MTDEARGQADSDQPLELPKDDTLDRVTFSERVVSTIVGRHEDESIVIGLYGPWGDGKTTVMNFMRADLRVRYAKTVIPVDFNPWLVGRADSLLRGFFMAVAEELDIKLGGKKQEVANLFRKIGSGVSALTLSADVAGLRPGTAATSIAELLAPSDIETTRRQFEQALRKAKRRVVVFIDDVDRLDDLEIREMFRLIRLVAPFAGITYVVACDDRAVARALATNGAPDRSGFEYLEKIVQVPLHIPPASPDDLFEWVAEGLLQLIRSTGEEVTVEEFPEIGERLRNGIMPSLRTPRAVKRYLNALSFALPMLRGNARLADVVGIEGMRVAFPAMYTKVRDGRTRFVTPPYQPFRSKPDDAAVTARVAGEIEGVPANERDEARWLLMTLFPSLGGVLSNSDISRLYAEQRVAHPDYFERYFTYSVSKDAIADTELTRILSNPDSIMVALKDGLEAKRDLYLVALTKKLAARIPALPDNVASTLLGVLPMLHPFLGKDEGRGFFGVGVSAHEALANLVARLIERLPAPDRLKATISAADAAGDPAFAIRISQAVQGHLGGSHKKLLEDAEERRLYRHLARLVVQSFGNDPIWPETTDWQRQLYLAAQFGQAKAVRTAVGRWLDVAPSSVPTFLRGMAGVAYGSRGITQNDFDRRRYEEVQQVVPLETIRRAIRRFKPRHKPSDWQDASDSTNPDMAVIDQFLLIERKIKEESKAQRVQ